MRKRRIGILEWESVVNTLAITDQKNKYLDIFVLDEAEIHDTKFNNSTWYALSVDLCLFNKTSFDKTVFRNMNFEFAIFQEIHMNNMKLPFPTIPYIFGGLKYLKETNDNVFVTSQQCLSEGLSKDEYLSLLDKLEIYYKNTNNYFPLANIYLSKDQIENSKSAIILGIERALMLHDLKLIENLTRLISFNSLFNMSERYDLLNYVVSKISAGLFWVKPISRRNVLICAHYYSILLLMVVVCIFQLKPT